MFVETIILVLLSVFVYYLLKQKHYSKHAVPCEEPYMLFVSNNSNEEKKAVLFGKYENGNLPNFGSDEGLFVNTVSKKYSYEELLGILDSYPVQLNTVTVFSDNEYQLEARIDYKGRYKGRDVEAYLVSGELKSSQLLHIPCKVILNSDAQFSFNVFPMTQVHLGFLYTETVYRETTYYKRISEYLQKCTAKITKSNIS